MKIRKSLFATLVAIFFIFPIFSCHKIDNPSNYESVLSNDSKEEEDMNDKLILNIDNKQMDVSWLENESVNALKNLAKTGLNIQLNRYSTFEQVGYLGSTLPSNDKQITTTPGDIVLYSSNQIVIFYGSNSWAYTKLGHINLNKNELIDILDKENVTINLSIN